MPTPLFSHPAEWPPLPSCSQGRMVVPNSSQIHTPSFQQSTPTKPAISGSSLCLLGSNLLAQLALATADQPPVLACGLWPCFRNMASLIVNAWGEEGTLIRGRVITRELGDTPRHGGTPSYGDICTGNRILCYHGMIILCLRVSGICKPSWQFWPSLSTTSPVIYLIS